MTNRLFNPERPPIGGHWRRFWLLERLVDYIAGSMVSIEGNETEAPAFGLRLDETSRPDGDRDTFIIYISQGEWAPSPDAPLIRRLRWSRNADRLLCQHGSVLWPDLDDELFRLDRADLSELERLADTLGHSLAALDDHGQWSLGLKQRYELQMPEWVEIDPAQEVRPPIVWRTVDYGDVKLTFMGGYSQKGVEDAFVGLWQFLEKKCTEDRRVEYPVVYRELAPEVFAKALRHAAGLQLDP